MTSDVETNIVAVERIKEYGETQQVCSKGHCYLSFLGGIRVSVVKVLILL
jgi:hypothetical protein